MKLSPKLILVLFSLWVAATATALNIKGTIRDSESEPLAGATIKLLAQKDSAFVKGTKTNDKGVFTLADVKKGSYIVEASYIGYANYYKNVTISTSSVTLDPVNMTESSIMLQEVVATGVKTQIKVMEDTIEYNADSYKVQPNAVVEDLLKRLPGVEVGSDGSITANGKTVSKILVDGKEFFSDDPKVASKNLPVEMVDKLQVVDRKSDLARLTGVDDGEEETVINLTVKKDMKNGYFGNIEAGYGTDDRYKVNFNLNKFWNENQMTLLGNFNNVNELGFTDSNGNRFQRFGGNNGITTSKALGLNFNVGNQEIFRVGGDVMYSYSSSNSIQSQERQYLFTDSTSYSSTDKWTRDRGHNLRADFRMQWKPDSFNTLDIRPNISYNRNDSWSVDSSWTRAGDAARSPVNYSYNNGTSSGHSLEYGAQAIYNHSFKHHRGRSFSVQARYSHSNVREKMNSYSRNIFYLFNDSLDLYDQFTNNHTWSDQVEGRLSWTEPLGNVKNGNFLTLSYRMQYRWNNADKLVYDHPVVYPDDPDYTGSGVDPVIDYAVEVLNEDLSNRFRNEYMNQDIRVGFKHVSSALNMEVGMSLVPTMMKSIDLINEAKNVPKRNVMNYAPFLRFRYRMSKTRSFNARYNGRSSQPSMTQLQPVADMSDPLRIVIGNPDLNPSFTHNLTLRFQDFNADAQRSIMAMANVSMTQNSIVSKTTYNSETGGQTTTYENVNGVWSGRLMMMFSTPFRNKAWQFSNNLFTNYNRSVGFNNGERNVSGAFSVSESFSLAFRPDNLELELRPNYSLQTTHNSLATTSDNTVHRYGASFNAYYYTPIGVVLATDVSYSDTKGYAAGYNQSEWMWNASISYQLLRSKSLTLSLKVYDLLQQKSNISRTITANYIDDSRYNSLTRYFMFTVAYRFNTFGKGKEPGNRGMDGPGGDGPGGRRGGGPGGPPPGGGGPGGGGPR